jgi:hypothetical protein
MGLLSAFTLGENLIKRVRDDFKAGPEELSRIEVQIENFYESYIQTMGLSEKLSKRALAYLRKSRRNHLAYKWLAAYRDLNTFRTSLPGEWVVDFAERERRNGDWDRAKYTVDVATLLRRAEGLRFNEKIPHPNGKMGMLTVRGYGRLKKVWVTPTFTDDQCGILYCTSDFPGLRFIQEGHNTSVSHVMTLRNHIFTVVPRSVWPEIDWRLPVFECGRHIIGFDGVALILFELFNIDLKEVFKE